MPFKIFVLLSGIANIKTQQLPGGGRDRTRVSRYGGEAWLAYEYGDEAGTYHPQQSADHLGLDAAVVVALGGVAYIAVAPASQSVE